MSSNNKNPYWTISARSTRFLGIFVGKTFSPELENPIETNDWIFSQGQPGPRDPKTHDRERSLQVLRTRSACSPLVELLVAPSRTVESAFHEISCRQAVSGNIQILLLGLADNVLRDT